LVAGEGRERRFDRFFDKREPGQFLALAADMKIDPTPRRIFE